MTFDDLECNTGNDVGVQFLVLSICMCFPSPFSFVVTILLRKIAEHGDKLQ